MEKITYKEAIEEIEKTITRLETEKPDVDELSASVKKVAELIRFCKEKLTKTDQEVEEILDSLK